jgi:hypothetical protein
MIFPETKIGQGGVKALAHDFAMAQFHLIDAARGAIPRPIA